MAHPLKAVLDIRRDELPQALLMFSYFLLVITTFWILKPIKKALFISHYRAVGGFDTGIVLLGAAQAELLAKVLNMVVAFVAAMVFSSLSNRYRRHHLTHIFGVFFIVCFFGYATILAKPAALTVWSFYLFGDLFSTLMVATFFVFLNDIVTPEAAKRTYGLIVLGGVAGGFLGSNVVRNWIDALDRRQWLWVCAGLTVAIMAAGHVVGRMHVEHPSTPEDRASRSAARSQDKARGAALDGARLVLRSRYLLAITVIVGVYEMVSTIMDFQFSATIAHFCKGPEIGRQIARAFAIMNSTAFVVQLFLTSLVMRRLGMGIALLVLPFTTALGSVAFLALPVLWVGRLIPTFDGAFSYSINQSAKESLYVPTTREEKYKAKAFIDMFVQRFAKALAVGVSLLLTTLVTDFAAVRWLSLVTAVLIGLWAAAARYAGKEFERYEAEAEANGPGGAAADAT